MESWDDVAEELRRLRVRRGAPSYGTLAAGVRARRRARGEPGDRPSRATVYECFRDGRLRMDLGLLADLGRALGLEGEAARTWDESCFAVQYRIEASRVVAVTSVDPSARPTGPLVGRGAEVERMAAARGRVVLHGLAGVGKTRLALEHVHRELAAGTARRALVVHLRGHDGSRPPADPGAARSEILRHLGSGPSGPGALTRALESARCLLVLDDAATADQVTSLLPDPPVPVLVTSRTALPLRLERVPVRPLVEQDAVALLHAYVGAPMVEQDAGSLASLARGLGGLPLALVVTGTLVRTSGWSLDDHATALREQLAMLHVPEPVRSSIARSTERLPGEARRVLRLLADQPCAALPTDAVAAMAGVDEPGARTALTELESAHLAARSEIGWSSHALVRAVAAGEVRTTESPSARDSARARLLEHLVEQAHRAVVAVGSPPFGAGGPLAQGPSAADQHDPAQAREWLRVNRDTLLALADPRYTPARPGTTAELSTILARHLENVGAHAAASVLHTRAATECQGSGDSAGQARASVFLAQSLARLGETQDAVAAAAAALDLVDRVGDPDTYASALNVLAVIDVQRGDLEDALGRLTAALAAVETGRTSRSPAALLGNIAAVRYELGDVSGALDGHERSRHRAAEEGDRVAEALAWTNLAEIHLSQGDAERAYEASLRATDIAVEHLLGVVEATARTSLGTALARLGRLDEAREQHRAALEVAVATGDRNDEAEAWNALGETETGADEVDAAREAFERAAELARSLGSGAELSRAEAGLRQLGDRTG